MERLGEILARSLYQSRRDLKILWIKHSSLTANKVSIFLIILLGIVPLTIYFLISGARFTLTQIVASYIFVILLFALALVMVIAWYKSEELLKNNVQGFSFLQLSPSRINADFFGFSNEDIENPLKLVNGLPAEIKIVIRETLRTNNREMSAFCLLFWI